MSTHKKNKQKLEQALIKLQQIKEEQPKQNESNKRTIKQPRI